MLLSNDSIDKSWLNLSCHLYPQVSNLTLSFIECSSVTRSTCSVSSVVTDGFHPLHRTLFQAAMENIRHLRSPVAHCLVAEDRSKFDKERPEGRRAAQFGPGRSWKVYLST